MSPVPPAVSCETPRERITPSAHRKSRVEVADGALPVVKVVLVLVPVRDI